MSEGRLCVIQSCGHAAEFLVEHPERGRLSVCGWHAEQIVALGRSEVSGLA